MNSTTLIHPAAAAPTTQPTSAARKERAERAGLLLDQAQEQAAFTQWTSDAHGERLALSQFQLSGMHCAACAGIIERALLDVPGVRAAQVSSAAARAQVQWEPLATRPSALIAAIQRAGYGAVPDLAAPARELRQREWRQALWRLFVAGFCMMQVMMVAAPAYLAAPGDISADLQRLLNWAAWLLSLPVLLFSATGFFRAAWQALRLRRIAMDLPVALGIAVTFIASSAAAFEPGGMFGSEVYFDSLTMFVFFLLGGRTLEMRARHRAAAALERSLNRLPGSVLRRTASGTFETVSVRSLASGDQVRVLAGDAFPADGELLEGESLADEALLTGESRPCPKRRGDVLVAGSLNLQAPVLMRVDRLGADTRFEAIVALMRGALLQRPAAVRVADRLAGPFLWGVLALAAGAALAWSIIDPTRAVWVAVSVLIVTCPCALSLAAPSALLAATGALARRGVLLRRIEALEVLARVDTLFIDKTGTLTQDRLALREVHVMGEGGSANDASKEDIEARQRTVLEQAAALAEFSSHPLSRALVEARQGMVLGQQAWAEVREVAGQGLQGRGPDSRLCRLGSPEWVLAGQAAGVGAANAQEPGKRVGPGAEAPESVGGVWFGPVGQPWAWFEFEEALRDDAQAALQQLRDAGVRIVLLSGDRDAPVQAMAARLGLGMAIAQASPEDKLATVAAAQAQGHAVAFAGDGLNDAPVLARADVSFALAHGAAISQSQADAVVLGNRLGDMAFAFGIARRTVRVIRQNLCWAVAYNASCIPLALLGWLPPWAAGLGMALSSLVVVLNAMRLARA